MQVKIFSKAAMVERLAEGPLVNTAVISFYNEPINPLTKPLDYAGKAECHLAIDLPDIDKGGLEEYGYTYDSFFSQADEVAAFIREAYNNGMDFACQCQFGFSRSAACAAAILEHFEGRGKEIFEGDYQPNLLIYNKLLESLSASPKNPNANLANRIMN